MQSGDISTGKNCYPLNDLLTDRDFVKVGYIGGLFGYEGDLRWVPEERIDDVLGAGIQFLYFIENGMYVPRFIASWNASQSLIRFLRFTSRESARPLTDQDVFLRHRDLPDDWSASGEMGAHWNMLKGYQIWDEVNELKVGDIESVVEFPGGWMGEVRVADRPDPIWIPLAEPLIRGLDHDHKMLIMNLPDGLLEL